MVKVCRALHEHTRYKVRVAGGTSEAWLPDRGLREGCPSSPPLFNVYHDAVMQDFRKRRATAAEQAGGGTKPGIRWCYKVDGRMTKNSHLRNEAGRGSLGRGIHETVIGDVGYADDTAIVGEEQEATRAEEVLCETLEDWEERVNKGKTERLRMGGRRAPYVVRGEGEKAAVRHVGGWLAEDGRQETDTAAVVTRGRGKVTTISKAWRREGQFGRGDRSGLRRSVKLTVMKAAAQPTILSFARSRAWTKRQIQAVQRIANLAVRRAMGMDCFLMAQHGVTDEALYRAVGWEQMKDVIHRQTMVWAGHVSRMPTHRLPKQALFGWIGGVLGKQAGVGVAQPRFVQDVLERAGVPPIDWFRQAQDRKLWRKTIKLVFPSMGTDPDRDEWLDRWRPGEALQDWRCEAREGAAGPGAVDMGNFECVVCGEWHATGNSLAHHYDTTHGIRDPDVVTLTSQRCERCMVYFPSRDQVRTHACVAKREAETGGALARKDWGPATAGPRRPPPGGVVGVNGRVWRQQSRGRARRLGRSDIPMAGGGV